MCLHFRASQHLCHSHKAVKKRLKRRKECLYREKNLPVSKSKIEVFQELCVLEMLDGFELRFYKITEHQKISQI